MITRLSEKLKPCIQESRKILRKTPGLPIFTLAKTCAKMEKGKPFPSAGVRCAGATPPNAPKNIKTAGRYGPGKKVFDP